MEFKNFDLNCYKLPDTEEYIGIFKIRWTNGTNTSFNWSIYSDNNTAQEGVVYNTLLSTNLFFSCKLNLNNNYFVMVNETDDGNVIVSRAWDFVKGDTLEKFNNESVLSRGITEKSLISHHPDANSFTFGSRSGLVSAEDWNFGDWNFGDFSNFEWSSPFGTDTSGWIVPSKTRASLQPINFPIPAITDEPFTFSPEIPEVSGTVDVVEEKCCEQDLDELIEQLSIMQIGELPPQEPEPEDIIEDWELELNRIIEELEEPLIKDKRIMTEMVLVENYLGEKTVNPMYFDHVPMPPPLPISFNRTNFTQTSTFNNELQTVRNRVMGRKNDESEHKSNKLKHTSSWFSLFR